MKYVICLKIAKVKQYKALSGLKYSQTRHAFTSIKRSPFSCPVIENFIWIEPLFRGYLS